MFDVYTQLPHAGIRSLAPYIPGKSADKVAEEQGITDVLKLASNENPLGCSPYAIRALATLTPHQLATYTVSTQHPLRHKLTSMLGVEEDMLALSNGSDVLFQLLMICFALHSEKHILTHEAAFISYEIQAKTFGIPVHHTPLKPDWHVDIDALIQACNQNTAMIFIANPNNPTGLLIPKHDICRLLEHIPPTTLLVLDQAYHEYVPPTEQGDTRAWLAKYPNLVITRTFSKAYGLAALRLGYALANPTIIELIYRVQLPFSVNQAAMTAAMAALDDQSFIQKTIEINAEGRVQMQAELAQRNLTQQPSFGNFITFDCGFNAMIIDQALQRQGVIVRPLTPYGLTQYLRVTIGTNQQNQRFLHALDQSLKGAQHHDK